MSNDFLYDVKFYLVSKIHTVGSWTSLLLENWGNILLMSTSNETAWRDQTSRGGY